MYNINRVIKKLTPHRSAAELFKYFSDEKDCVFLDSSLVNGLGRYSHLRNISKNICLSIKIRTKAGFQCYQGQSDIFRMNTGGN